MFIQDVNKIPEAFKQDNLSLDEIDVEIYAQYASQEIPKRQSSDPDFKSPNLFSRLNNVYFYQLLRLFGFWDESLISFIDKDDLKQEYYKSRPPFQADDFFEHFLVSYGIKVLNDFRENHLKDIDSFRKITMSTQSDVTWTKDLLDQSLDITEIQKAMNDNGKEKNPSKTSKQGLDNLFETSQDIFNYSFKILTRNAFRKYNRYGINLALDH